jgi:hypothetical protein
MGYNAVAAATDLSFSVLTRVRQGKRKRIFLRTEQTILSVDSTALSDAALVPAQNTWKLLQELLDRGFSQAQLCRWLGYKSRKLQINRQRVWAKTALRVERMAKLLAQGKLRRAVSAEGR